MLLFAFAACSAVVPTVSAQESGWWIGGRVGYWHDKVEGVTSSGVALGPQFGHAFNAEGGPGGRPCGVTDGLILPGPEWARPG